MSWVCVDFGTCNSAAAIEINGTPIVVTDGYDRLFPTEACVLSHDNIIVCKNAGQFRDRYPQYYLKEFKLHIHEYQNINGSDYRRIVSEILKYIKNCAERANNGNIIENVLLTIPSVYTITDPRKQCMSDSAYDAGFQHVEFLEEAEAAARHYAMITGESNGISLIYDLGGGTFDPALIEIKEGEIADYWSC